MATIYGVPKEIKIPELNFGKFQEYEKQCDIFTQELKMFLKKLNPKEKNVGEIIKFPVGDGYAEYMVASVSKELLVHLPLMDAWDFEYAHLLTSKEILEKINQQKALQKLFSTFKK